METPAPNPSDSEDVTTALETAEIFAKKGDATEAAHWLSRAAEFAKRDGNEARASEIERAAAAPAAPAEPAEPAEPAAERERHLPTPPPLRVSVRPPPPSERGRPPPLPTSLSSRPSTASPPVARAPSTSAMSAAAHAPTTSLPSTVKEHQEESAVRESSPSSGPVRGSSESRASKPPAHFEPNRPFRLHGARVSITQSPGTTRFYVLKVLDDGEPLPSDGHEAFIVLADPNTKLSR